MANKEFHELITAEEMSASDIIASQRENGGVWLTRKNTFNALGLFLNKVLNYASDLHTTSKTIIGAINELAQGSGQSLDTLNDVDIDAQTLTDGQGIVYDATAQKWKNGAVSGGGHTYSTTEQVVGTWIDGSTIYEKTINFGTLPNSTTKSVAHGISNLGVVVSCSGVSSDGTNSLALCYVNGSNDRVGVYFDSTNANIMTSTDISAYTETYITVQYTKTST